MSSTVKAFVEYIHAKERNSTRPGGGTYTSYNAKLQDPDTGKVLEQWFQFGFNVPKNSQGRAMVVGDYIQVTAESHGDAQRVVDGSLKIHPNPPARPGNPDKQEAAPAKSSGGYKAPTKEKSELFGNIGGYFTEDDVARIARSTALSAATTTVEMLLKNNALKVSEAQGAAGVVKRYDQVVTAIDKLATKYFFDLATGRQLEAHEDEGTVAGAQTSAEPLPNAEPTGGGEDFGDIPEDDFPEDSGEGFE